MPAAEQTIISSCLHVAVQAMTWNSCVFVVTEFMPILYLLWQTIDNSFVSAVADS